MVKCNEDEIGTTAIEVCVHLPILYQVCNALICGKLWGSSLLDCNFPIMKPRSVCSSSSFVFTACLPCFPRMHAMDQSNKENHPESYDNIPDYDNLQSDSDDEVQYRDYDPDSK